MRRRFAAVLLLLAGSCVGPNPAEVATYEAIAPEYRAYVEADPTLQEADKERRYATLDRWAAAIGVEGN